MRLGLIKRIFEDNKRVTTGVGSAVIFILMIIIFWDMAGVKALTSRDIEAAIQRSGKGNVFVADWSQYDSLEAQPKVIQDYATEGEANEKKYDVADFNVHAISFKLTWKDEDDVGWIGPSPNHQNEPDKFTLSVIGPDGSVKDSDSGSNQHGKEGLLEMTLEVPTPTTDSLNGTGEWNITITVEAGDHEPTRIGLFKFLDKGNDFTLEITHEYYKTGE